MMTRRQSVRATARPQVFVMVVVVWMTMLAASVRAATPTDGCCAKCIGKTSSVAYTYDPLVYAQCSAAGGVCCFNCNSDSASAPTVENADYGADGVTPEVKAGVWIQLTWSNIARVTYETYKVNQTKTTTVVNGSNEATLEDGVFFICAKSPGSVVVRGWGTDPCTTATVESSITILSGSSNGTCASRTPSAPTTTDTPATTSSASSSKSDSTATDEDSSVGQCNLQRASVNIVDGKKTCVCASEWTGPPDCGGYPWWKTAATIGGAVAALLSIAVSIRAFLNSRKANTQEQQERSRGAPVLGEESIKINDSAPVIMAAPDSDNAYEQAPQSIKTRQSKEYTL